MAPFVHVLKVFFIIRKATAFVLAKPVQPSLTLESKAGAYPKGAPL
jgi:hypothetical protein